jgi:hypothetical protein
MLDTEKKTWLTNDVAFQIKTYEDLGDSNKSKFKVISK